MKNMMYTGHPNHSGLYDERRRRKTTPRDQALVPGACTFTSGHHWTIAIVLLDLDLTT